MNNNENNISKWLEVVKTVSFGKNTLQLAIILINLYNYEVWSATKVHIFFSLSLNTKKDALRKPAINDKTINCTKLMKYFLAAYLHKTLGVPMSLPGLTKTFFQCLLQPNSNSVCRVHIISSENKMIWCYQVSRPHPCWLIWHSYFFNDKDFTCSNDIHSYLQNLDLVKSGMTMLLLFLLTC